MGGAFDALRLVARFTGKSVSGTVSVLVVGPLRFEDRAGCAAACFFSIADITGASAASVTAVVASILAFLPRAFMSEVDSGGTAAAFFDALLPVAVGSLGVASLRRVLFSLPSFD